MSYIAYSYVENAVIYLSKVERESNFLRFEIDLGFSISPYECTVLPKRSLAICACSGPNGVSFFAAF